MKIEPKGKTLAELDVKPGDVVTLAGKSQSHHTLHHMTGDGRWCTGEAEYSHLVRDPVWRIVSRANEPTEDKPHHGPLGYGPKPFGNLGDKPKTWGEMTRLEQGEILVDDHNGLPIEAFVHSDFWEEKKNCFPYFPNKSYRTRKEPVRETVTLRGWINDKLDCYFDADDTNNAIKSHRITFDTIDGKPDCNSIVMEAIGDE